MNASMARVSKEVMIKKNRAMSSGETKGKDSLTVPSFKIIFHKLQGIARPF